jgi:hypothetical protein
MSNHQNWGKKYREYVTVSPHNYNDEGYHGNSFVSPRLQSYSNTTCKTAETANAINALTALPVIYYGFQALGLVGGSLITGFLGWLIWQFSNYTARTAASNTQGNRSWSNSGLLMFLTINILLTLLSAVGAELITNRNQLKENLADQVISEKTQNLQPDSSIYQSEEEECQRLQSLLDEQPREHPKWNTWKIEADGSYENRNRNWQEELENGAISESQIPVCPLAAIKREQAEKEAAEERATWQEKLNQRANYGSDVVFLEENSPALYEQDFTEEGEIRSGIKALSLAYDSFFGRLLEGDLDNLGEIGFSGFIFLLSIVTSTGACILLIAFTNSKETQLSHNPQVREAILKHLEYLETQVLALEDPQPATTHQRKKSFSQTNQKEVDFEQTHASTETAGFSKTDATSETTYSTDQFQQSRKNGTKYRTPN